jgi:hypothetical protein
MSATVAPEEPPAAAPPREDAVFALFDGDYHLGLGALVNSLYAHGFRGVVYAGYRGALPPWAKPVVIDGKDHLYAAAPGCVIRFVPVDFYGHLTNYKPTFMLAMLERCCADAKRLFYFDVDIVIKCRWSFLQHWAECGIAVCQDVIDARMAPNHPMRKYWHDIGGRLGLNCHPIDGYFNAGFVASLSTHAIPLLRDWQTVLTYFERSGTSLANFHLGDRTGPVMAPDQDALNIALMASSVPLSPMDNSAMDVTPGGYVMAHALARAKPWRRRYLRDALLGYPPDSAGKLYWKNVTAPIAVFPPHRRTLARLSIAGAAAIGRFYRRR